MSWLDAQPELPATWAWARIDDVADVALGKMLDAKRQTGEHAAKYVRNINVQWHSLRLDDLLVMDVAPSEYERYSIRAGDLLVCEGGEPGRCAIVPAGGDGLAYQKALHRVRPRSAMDVRYLAYAFEYMTKAGHTQDALTGSTIKHLPLEKVVALPIPLAPPEEQRRVADLLDAQSTLTDAAIAGLRALVGNVTVTADSRLGQFRKSLLAAAFNGRLTAKDAADTSVQELLLDTRQVQDGKQGRRQRRREGVAAHGQPTTATALEG